MQKIRFEDLMRQYPGFPLPDGSVVPWDEIDFNPKQPRWQQVHVRRLVKFLRENSDAPSAHILAYLLENKNGDNVITVPVRTIAEECHVNPLTVQRLFKKMYANKDLRKIRNGQYQLNPDIISFGKNTYARLRQEWQESYNIK